MAVSASGCSPSPNPDDWSRRTPRGTRPRSPGFAAGPLAGPPKPDVAAGACTAFVPPVDSEDPAAGIAAGEEGEELSDGTGGVASEGFVFI